MPVLPALRSRGTSLSRLSVETLPTKGKALPIARVTEGATLERLAASEVCLIWRDTHATLDTMVISAILWWSSEFCFHTNNKGLWVCKGLGQR